MAEESFERIRDLSERLGCTQGMLIEALIEADDEAIFQHFQIVAPILEEKTKARKEKRKQERALVKSLTPEEIQAIVASRGSR